jgi:hypothetical protein
VSDVQRVTEREVKLGLEAGFSLDRCTAQNGNSALATWPPHIGCCSALEVEPGDAVLCHKASVSHP